MEKNSYGAIVMIVCAFVTVLSQDPEFAEPITNRTVAAGRDITLACVINNLGTYKVAWIHYERSAILTVHNSVITRNHRISVSHNNHHRTWHLHIHNVKVTDQGGYMCQINTEPVSTQIGYLTVVVPPDIVDEETSSEVMAREMSNVTLRCQARGSPTPTITWRREDNAKFFITKGKEVTKVEGQYLKITRVSRLHMGAYLCIAQNGVPPAVSKRIILKVDFPPMLWIPHQLVGAPVGYSAVLECNTEAHPKSINYWAGEDGLMIFPSEKYLINMTESGYSLSMQIKIQRITRRDFGEYRCIAKNPVGETEGTIKLYETDAPSTTPWTPITPLQGRVGDHTMQRAADIQNPSSLRVGTNDDVSDNRLKKSRYSGNKSDDAYNSWVPDEFDRTNSGYSTESSILTRVITILITLRISSLSSWREIYFFQYGDWT